MNWAAPHPNFVGVMFSERICPAGSGGYDCTGFTGLAPIQGSQDGQAWSQANFKGTNEEINFGARNISEQGGSPFGNSLHPDGIVVGMADGSARFVTEGVNGAVWAKLFSPDGGNMPPAFRQLPLSADQIPGSQ
jgi:hypothetical protein